MERGEATQEVHRGGHYKLGRQVKGAAGLGLSCRSIYKGGCVGRALRRKRMAGQGSTLDLARH